MRLLRIIMVVSLAVLTLGAIRPPVAAAAAGGRGVLLHAAPLAPELRLAGAGRAWELRYTSTARDGRRSVVSGTLTLPPGRPPKGGWPVVSFGHGFGGVADACAPSRTGPSPWERALNERLLAAGYAIAATDFEGIGTPGSGPGMNGRVSAYNMIDIVRAARRLAPVSHSWLAVGYSLGGHAALFAGSVAQDYGTGLRHAGVIALAPFTQWRLTLGAPAGRDPSAPVNHTVPYLGYGLAENTDFAPADWYTPAGLELVAAAGEICVGEMIAKVTGLTNGDVLRDPSAATDEFLRRLADQEVPVTGYRRPVRIAHGTEDVLPVAFAELTARQLAAAGVDAGFTPVPGEDHLTLLPAVAPQAARWAAELFARR